MVEIMLHAYQRKTGPNITHIRLINKFMIVSEGDFLYPPFWILKDMSNKPKNINALPAIMVKKIPKVSSKINPIAATNKHGVIHPKSGTGNERSKAK